MAHSVHLRSRPDYRVSRKQAAWKRIREYVPSNRLGSALYDPLGSPEIVARLQSVSQATGLEARYMTHSVHLRSRPDYSVSQATCLEARYMTHSVHLRSRPDYSVSQATGLEARYMTHSIREYVPSNRLGSALYDPLGSPEIVARLQSVSQATGLEARYMTHSVHLRSRPDYSVSQATCLEARYMTHSVHLRSRPDYIVSQATFLEARYMTHSVHLRSRPDYRVSHKQESWKPAIRRYACRNICWLITFLWPVIEEWAYGTEMSRSAIARGFKLAAAGAPGADIGRS
ncbi:hypothetical protein J6590_012942 [Homalodisca vitripennis]|nr:hypothetical protein J6590_093581 [Homalodisca vitripennis]KAG8322949.1 hypothetical protein J6590_012942 [Homalodisca vitripennis]